MSAESELSAMLSHATSNANSLAASSADLVGAAIAVLASSVDFPDPPTQIAAAGLDMPWMTLPQVSERETSPEFPQWPEIEFSEPPSLQATGTVATLGGAGSQVSNALPDFPQLTLPSFNYATIPRLAGFSKALPRISTDIHLPNTPDLNLPNTPQWMPLRTIAVPSLSMQSPTFTSLNTSIDFDPSIYQEALDRFNTAIFNGAGGLPGLDSLLHELRVWMDGILEALLPSVLSILAERFTSPSAKILAFHDAIQVRLTERLQIEQARVAALVATDRSGWDLPALVSQALTATAQQISQSWVRHAQSQVETKVETLKMEFFEFCGSLYEPLQKALITAKTKEIEYVLEAHRLSIAYAKLSVKSLLSLYNLENFTQQDFYFKKAEAELQLFEANLKVAMIRYEVAQAKLSAEKARQSNDSLEIKQYQQETEAASLDVQMYASQVGAARIELELKKLPFEVFAAQVKAFDAQIDGHTALVKVRIAELEGDSAKVEGEKAKLKAYLAEVRGFEKTIQAKRETVNAQINRGDAVVAQYEAEIRAFFAPIEQSLLQNEYELRKYTVLAEDYLADARWAAKAAQLELDFLQKEQDGLMLAFQETQERGIELMKFELKRLDAVAEVNARGAAIMADMAGGAMSAANGIASVVFKEDG